MKYSIIKDFENDFSLLSFSPTLCIGYYVAGSEMLFEEQCKRFRASFPQIDIIACSTDSNIQDTIPYISTQSSIFICIDMKRDAYKLKVFNHIEQKPSLEAFTDYRAIVYSLDNNKNLKDLLSLLGDVLGVQDIYGGIASSATSHSMTNNPSIYYNGKHIGSNETLIWLIHKDHYDVSGLSIHDFEPVGLELAITKSSDTTIKEIENEPALDVIENMIGRLSDAGLAHYDYPLFLSHTKFTQSKTKTPLASIKDIDRDEKSLELFKHVEVGDKIRLAIPLSKKNQELQIARLIEHSPSSGISLIFACMAFKGHWAEIESLYLMRLSRQLKTPFIGLHTFGEIGPLSNQCSSLLQNQTLTLVTITKKKLCLR